MSQLFARRHPAIFALVTTCLTSLLPATQAQTAPPASSVPLRIVVPFPPGTAVDILARDLGNRLAPLLNRPVVIDNKAGAGGNIGTENAVHSPPDGSTVLLTVNTTININPLIYTNLKYNPAVDLVPIASLSKSGYLLAAGPKLPYRNVHDLIAAARQKPDTLTYASYGNGTMAHVCMEQFQAATGTQLRHVPFRGAFAPELMSGVVDVAFENLAPAIPLVKDQRLMPLAVTLARVDALPDVPAIKEEVPNFECYAWAGIFAPKGMPQALQKQLSEQITQIVRSPGYVALADRLGSIPAPMEQGDFVTFVRADAQKWKAIIPSLNIKLD